ncbi:MAG: hypothetical protein ACLTBZ_11815 [Faecalispora jeddahensis]|uniref:hypothetical protein n=1 Tax=Faecalispora jeddahensis TaxID=1414721 RepID=UPI003992E1AA
MANTLSVIFRLNDNFSSLMKSIITATAQAEKQQTQLNKALKNMHGTMGDASGTRVMSDGINSITRRITGLVSAAYLGKKALDVMFAAVKTGAEKQVQLNTFQSLLNSDEAGKALYDYTNLYGKQKSVLGSMGIANATKSFLPFTQDIDQLNKLYQLTERLYSRDPTQGSEGAVFAMKELISGDIMSARERFNISGISGATIRDFANTNDINGLINYLDQTFNRFGATQGIVDKNFTSLQTQATKFGDNVRSALGDESSPVVQNLSTLFQQLNADMDSGKFAPFFNLMGNGMVMLGNGLSWVAENGATLIPIVGGVASALVIFNTAMGLARTFALATGATISLVSGQWIAAAAIIAGAAATIGLAASLNQQNGVLGKQAEDLAKSAATYKNALSTSSKSSLSAAVPTEVTNTAPIAVKGTVEIEKESLRYQFDLAAQKAFAMFNMTQVNPSVTIQNQNVSQVADLEEINQSLGDMVYQNQQTQSGGLYA